MSLMIIDQPQNIEIIQPTHRDSNIIIFPNFEAAYEEVIEHYSTLPSADNPKDEQFSQRDCRLLTRRFMDFLSAHADYFDYAIPDERMMKKYMVSLMTYAHRTIVKYMTYARHYCKALSRQRIPSNLSGQDYINLSELRTSVRNAADLKNPPKKRKVENEESVYSYGKRLTQPEIQSILDCIDKSTLTGLRDAAFLLTAFTTGFRLSELARITLNSISEFQGAFSIKVRAKGNKYFPRAVATIAVRSIHAYVDAYNNQLPPNDPRRIQDDEPVWKPLTRTGGIFDKPRKGLSTRAISKMIEKRSLAPDTIGKSCLVEPHDIRRTWSALADQLGMPDEDIQMQMLHESLDQTKRYIARPRDVAAQDITKYGLSLHL